MKLKLTNFKCYESKEIRIPDSGLTLISGMSGVGKSSILIAIHYALFGTEKKTISFGKTTSSVSFRFGNLSIKRTRRPNTLVVKNVETNEEYQDDGAQAIINSIYGERFDVSAYVKQNAIHSFVLMGGIEKLEFLEKYLFRNVFEKDISKIKEELKLKTREREKELDKARTVRECFDITDDEKNVEYTDDSLDSSVFLSERLELLIQKLEKEKNNESLLTNRLEIVRISLEQIEREQQILKMLGDEALGSDTESVSLSSLKKSLETMMTAKKTAQEISSLTEEVKVNIERISSLTEQEDLEIERKIEVMRDESSSLKEMNYYTDGITELKDTEDDILTIIRLETSLAKYKDVLDEQEYSSVLKETEEMLSYLLSEKQKAEMEKELLSCPACNASVRLQERKLVLFETKSTSSSISDLEEKIERLKEKKTSLSGLIKRAQMKEQIERNISDIKNEYEEFSYDLVQIRGELEELSVARERKAYLQAQIHSLDKKSYSLSLRSLITENREKEKKLTELKKKNSFFISSNDEKEIEETREKIIMIEKAEENRKKISQSKENVSMLRKRIGRDSIESLSRSLSLLSVSVLEKEIEDVTSSLTKAKRIEKKREYEELIRKEKEAERKFMSCVRFREKLLSAENVAIASVLNTINVNVNEFLELFFPENGNAFMSARLVLDGRSVNVNLSYKDGESDLGSLSGGEFSRVVLAFSLALAQMFNVPFLMLDECTASLDVLSNETVLEGIKNVFCSEERNIPVIVVSHQASTKAIFDHVIEL